LPGFDLSYGFMNRWGIGYSGEVQIYKSGTGEKRIDSPLLRLICFL